MARYIFPCENVGTGKSSFIAGNGLVCSAATIWFLKNMIQTEKV